ncbi:hypothetical protein, partial [Exiguobacterium acetylicum]|uniref:hypothetical protein n=1 Tax=Exiguobacterium acetylicum TaxID=41170 RepID=UPI001E44F6E3
PFLRRDTSQLSCLIQAGKLVLFVSDSAKMRFFLWELRETRHSFCYKIRVANHHSAILIFVETDF